MDKIQPWELFCFDEVTSTNDKAKELCREGGHFYVVSARKQTKGRGRRGHHWVSQEGNLFCSLAFEFSLQDLGAIVLLTSLSLLQTITSYDQNAEVTLKWPNDVLLNKAKISGILIEKAEQDYWIIGIGVNIKQAPELTDCTYKATSLMDHEIDTSAPIFLQKFLHTFTKNIDMWHTAGFASVKNSWLSHAPDLGRTIKVRLENQNVEGVFTDIDNNGFLLLKTNTGVITITAGEIFTDR